MTEPNYHAMCFEMLRELEYLTIALRRYGAVGEADRASNFNNKIRRVLLNSTFSDLPN